MPTPSSEAAPITRPFAAVRRAFVERDDPAVRSPLETLMSGQAGSGGGAGGRLRIALLLSILWVQAQPPYSSHRVAPWWARLLQLPDPTGTGARQIRDALHDLEERAFISLTRTDGGVNEIRLLEELGRGRLYTYPDPALQQLYMRIPRALWAEGWIAAMSGRALAVYLAVLANSGWRDVDFWMSPGLFHERYGMGETTRKKGFQDLVDLGALDVVARATTVQQGSRTFRRNVYTLRPELRSTPVPLAATTTTSTLILPTNTPRTA